VSLEKLEAQGTMATVGKDTPSEVQGIPAKCG